MDEIPDVIQKELERIDTNAEIAIEKNKELREENDRLRQRIAELEEIVDPDPTGSYDNLTKDQKVRKIRKALLRDAMTAKGTVKMRYNEVRALFDNNVSPGHAYNLMEAAASMDGFEYDRAGQLNQGQKRVRVDSDAVNDESLIQSVNKANESLPA